LHIFSHDLSQSVVGNSTVITLQVTTDKIGPQLTIAFKGAWNVGAVGAPLATSIAIYLALVNI
jgi:hypothetical protein